MGALTSAFIGAVPGANPQSPGLAGVSIDGTGKFTFDRTKFLAAFDADPQGVTKLFAQGGSSDNAERRSSCRPVTARSRARTTSS